MRLLGALSASAALLAFLCPSLVRATKKPAVNIKEFDHIPQSYFYFEDSPVILSLEQETGILWRSDNDGEKWSKVDDIPEKKALDIYVHPFDPKAAFLLTKGKTQYVTNDQGKSWKTFETELAPSLKRNPLSFHSQKKDYIIYTGMECTQDPIWGIWLCDEYTYHTKNGFEKSPEKLVDRRTHGCMFAWSTDLFDQSDKDTILCITDGASSDPEARILLVSNDFFKNSKEPKLDGFREMTGLTGLAAVKRFIVAAVKSPNTDEMALFVSDDAENWDRAEFPSEHGGLKQDAYTILESTSHSIEVDVLITTGSNPIGSLFTSNSNGTYFTKNIDYTNRDQYGVVDFEQVAGINGIVLVNIVDNAEDILQSRGSKDIEKKIKSKISFDGGRTFKSLKAGDDELHVHSVTDVHNGGRVFSSPAPGILMAVGNTGKYLKHYEDGDLYVSDDAGLTWKKALNDAHRYEFGDSGSILVAAFDEGRTNKIKYSLNHGKDWEDVDLKKEVRVLALTTVPDSTTTKFTLIAQSKDDKGYVIALNFDGVFERQCKKDDDEKKSDFEKWYARLDENEKPDCLMGYKQFYYRRKKDADCYVGGDYKEPQAQEEICDCTDEDYECDFEFADKEGNGKCVLIGKLPIPAGACKKKGDKFKGSSGYRLIPGNKCKKKDNKKDEPIERDCDEEAVVTPPSDGKIKSTTKSFDAGGFVEYYYLERARSAEGKDETIVMRTDKNHIYITYDQGATWEMPKELKDEEITAIYPNPYNNDMVFFLTPGKKFYYTFDRGKTIQSGEALEPPTRRDDISLAVRFHPTKSDRIMWIADRFCTDPNQKDCHAAAYHTLDRGANWKMLNPYVRNCAWIHSKDLPNTPENLIFCEKYEKEERPGDDNPIKLVSSDDYFEKESKHFDRIMGFATMEEFIVVAAVKDDGTLKLDASIDGKTFADARFPHNFQVDKQQAYTVLDSVTHAIFLHVTVNPMRGSEYGAIIKSNADGVSYVLSLANVNRNEAGYVDFEKMQGLEGVAIVNVVMNVDETNKGAKKKLKSMITHNDGGAWSYLSPPEKDAEGKGYGCDIKDLDKCSLNLHGYTERKDPRDTFSSGSAIGLMIGVGNVGEYLTGKSDGNTYLTRDGGITWKEIKKGSYMWEYGDQGSIIVIVDENEPTDKVYYSLDEGGHWQEFKFGDKMKVEDITTIPSDTSRRFLLWGNPVGKGEKAITVQIDFSGLTTQQCEVNESDDKESDFELWEPRHPNLESEHACLFGHRVKYYRKKPDRNCFVGPKGHNPVETEACPCNTHDYECDFNYERGHDGRCYLIKGLTPPNHKEECAKNKTLVEWYEATGYRRIRLTKCTGGKELDKSEPKMCPGHEKEFNERHGVSGWAVFFGVVFALGGAAAVGYYVWNRWNGKFGAIRLGEDSSSGGQSPLVRYPIIAVSALVAVAVAIPAIVQAIVGWVGSKLSRPKRFTTRGSFARGNYAVVSNDEGELLGSDDEDEV
ncbi:hypothetical protein BDZ91DRAFT_847692 [Kalaharituber pfeilii]|nr:hypothetical protein BDZ91DRAFT_847692 [Kalaharituber pfeilii]